MGNKSDEEMGPRIRLFERRHAKKRRAKILKIYVDVWILLENEALSSVTFFLFLAWYYSVGIIKWYERKQSALTP